ncbi:MAG TPA: SRPBCC family protein [Pseudorhizobium sp.]|nr:SRPBCC family protein [Pseudorhizobium sp.]
MQPAEARIIHITIHRGWQAVYYFMSQPQNMAQWAAGLAAGLRQEGQEWIGDGGPLGDIRVRFAPRNPFGVVDHDVILPGGTIVHNALRVVPNGDGAEVMFTLVRQPEMDDAAFETDAAAIARDLSSLKSLLERR